ncbi:chorismate mutase, partial [Mycobacterium sp. Y57]|nr:chorismate mutase [Mycolicibacterium xanthum]
MEDPAREQQVLDAVSVVAAGLNLDPAYVASVFRDQIDA